MACRQLISTILYLSIYLYIYGYRCSTGGDDRRRNGSCDWRHHALSLNDVHEEVCASDLSQATRPAGHSRVNGVRRYISAKTLNFNLRRRHNFISISFKFSVGDNVREVTSCTEFGSDPMSVRDATWGQHIRVQFLKTYLFSNV